MSITMFHPAMTYNVDKALETMMAIHGYVKLFTHES